MSSKQSSLDRWVAPFREATGGLSNRWIEEQKRAGRPVVGYACSYLPTEVVAAAGALPVRLRGVGCEDSGAADAYMSSRTCSAVRHLMALVLEGKLDFLAGQISANTCDHVRRAHDLWRHKTGLAYHGFLSVPRNARESLFPYFLEEVRRIAVELEERLGGTVTDESLAEAAEMARRARRLLGRIDELRAREGRPLTGAETLTVSVASTVMPAQAFVAHAEALVAAAEEAEPGTGPTPRARLLLAGGHLDDGGYVEVIESQGGAVVADTLCFGARAAEEPEEPAEGDLFEQLCRRAFFRTPCARMIGNFQERYEALERLVAERRVDGVVFQRLKFCDPWGGEAHNLRLRLKERGLPLLVLDREAGSRHAGQVSTRVQAFLELIEASRRDRSALGSEDAP